MEKFEKTPSQVAALLERWFHKYVAEGREPENFGLFTGLPAEVQQQLISLMALPVREIPVFVLTVTADRFVVNTTERFLLIADAAVESLAYTDFHSHSGYLHLSPSEEGEHHVKAEGRQQDFKMLKNDGTAVIWSIATGRAGFKFWNVTKKCDIIGRKYIIRED
ncbi:hypothetical protein MKQ68_19740 [Chitinophaga horti]|uniref:Uncharacterized protein n=1 Tax=Chitinophaga horti TaxID=2920382 RepID=A0ABY6J1U8_9BACT|nr:hypothetical protein [Chitinophaga horti]UYQ92321.1 hypothetical protein MKQ68_19740 [Chitinophaga horti]